MSTIPRAINCDDAPAVEASSLQYSSLPRPSLGRAKAERRLGLSTSHISPFSGESNPVVSPLAQMSYAVGGELVEVRVPVKPHDKRKPQFELCPDNLPLGERPTDYVPRWQRKKRGKVKGFSRACRGRMMRKVACIDQSKVLEMGLGKLITLTYPAEYSEDPERWSRDLDTFLKRFEREYGKVAILWKKEFQMRGAPHYHLQVLGAPLINLAWVARAWYEVVGSGDPKHLIAGTRVEAIRSWRGLKSYVSKYLGKEEEPGSNRPENTGRCWGVRNWHLVKALIETAVLTAQEFYAARRLIRKLLVKRGRLRRNAGRYGGVWCFLTEAEVLRILRWLLPVEFVDT